MLALSPDVLLLDEPTNHLDMESVEWLERFINTYPGTILMVSHDRMLLDRVTTRIAEIRNGKLQSYPGNYSEYIKKRVAEDLGQQRAYTKQQEHVRQTEAYIRRFKAGIKAKQARGRQSQLDRLARLEAPDRSKSITKLTMNTPGERSERALHERYRYILRGKAIIQPCLSESKKRRKSRPDRAKRIRENNPFENHLWEHHS